MRSLHPADAVHKGFGAAPTSILQRKNPKTITKNARKDTGNTADRHMKQILEIYNGSSRSLSLPVKR